MKAEATPILELLRKAAQLEVPIYQRQYSWQESHVEQLWADILAAADNPGVAAHFVGSVVYVQGGLYSTSHNSSLLIIDGQQRLTSISLLLAALCRRLGDETLDDEIDALSLRFTYLFDERGKGDKRYKLLLSQSDRSKMCSIARGDNPEGHADDRLAANLRFFESRLAAEMDLNRVWRGLAKLTAVEISLDRDRDNPQLIFESMNSTGLDLSQADLIRNFVLMGLEPTEQTRLYEQYWLPMEQRFRSDQGPLRFDRFVRHYLTVRMGRIPGLRSIYRQFKLFAQQGGGAWDVEVVVRDLESVSKQFVALATATTGESSLDAQLRSFAEMEREVAFPLLLAMYQHLDDGVISTTEFTEVVRLIESYLFRQAVSGLSSGANKFLATLHRNLDETDVVYSLQRALWQQKGSARFPADAEFQRLLADRDVYNWPLKGYLLGHLENSQHSKEPIDINSLTIEHVLPQGSNVPTYWKDELGEDWLAVWESQVHTLGNLTLTGYNQSLSNRPFEEKRDGPGGFSRSPLALNASIALESRWDGPTIYRRGQMLSEWAAQIWPSLRVPEAEAEAESSTGQNRGGTPKYQRHLEDGSVGGILFARMEPLIRAMDERIVVKHLHVYVSFKAGRIVADAVPQRNALKFTINLPIEGVVDPRGLCRDVRGIGRHGTGETQFSIASVDDIEYGLMLIKQSVDARATST